MHPIENIMQTSFEQIKNMVDVATVVGEPIVTENRTMVLPVSKLCLGFLVGGGEYGNMTCVKKAGDEAFRDARFPFAGASTVGMSVKPLAFVAVEDGNVRVLPAEEKCTGDRLMDILPHIAKGIDKLIEAGIECLKGTKGCSSEKSGLQSCSCEETAKTPKTPNASAEDVNAHECGKAEKGVFTYTQAGSGENADAADSAGDTGAHGCGGSMPADSEF